MARTALISTAFADHPAMDVAVSHAVLDAVVAGELGPTIRVHVPSSILAFGKADRVRDGYDRAIRAAEAHGFAAVERLAGGRAAVFHPRTLAFSWASPDSEPRARIRDRFELISSLMARAFATLGLDARVGELPGEYCPGQWSVNVGGISKVMGVGQRLVRGGAHVGGVVVVDDAEPIRDVLVPVYRAIHFDWDPRRTGALADRAPGLDTDRVAAAIIAEMRQHFDIEETELPGTVIDRARELIPEHIPGVR